MTVAFALGIGVIHFGRLEVSPALLYVAAVGVFLLSLVCSLWKRGFLAGLLVVVALLGALRYRASQPSLESLYRRAPRLREVTGTVVSYPELGATYTAFILAPDSLPARVRVTCFWEGALPTRVLYGDRLHLVGEGEVPSRFSDFDYRAYLARQGIFATMAVSDGGRLDRLGSGGNPVLRAGDELRQRFIERLDRLLPSPQAGLARSLLFGERAGLPEEVEEAFRRTGLMHLLAVSGLHLGIFLAGLWFALRLFGLRPVIAYPLVGGAVLLALWVVGPRVSLVRASLMFSFLGLGSVLADLGIVLRRWVSPYQGLAAAVLAILAMRPAALFEVGFQLSFAATAAIIAAFDPSVGAGEWLRSVAERWPLPAWTARYPLALLVASLAGQAGTAPFLAWHFGEFHPFLVAANLAVIPLATCALWGGLATLLFLATPLLIPLATLFSRSLSVLIRIVTRLSGLPFATLSVPPGMGIWLGGFVLFGVGVAIYSRGASSWTLNSTSIASRFSLPKR